MSRRQAEVEQGGDLHRFQQLDRVEREAFTIPEFFEVLFTPDEHLFCGTFAVGKIGKVGSAVG
jgi:hypothetical protein